MIGNKNISTKRYLKTKLGTVDLKKGTDKKPYYELGDKFIFYPEYHGRIFKDVQEELEVANTGEIAEVVGFKGLYYILEPGMSHIPRYEHIVIKVGNETMARAPVFWRLGWKLKK